MKMMRFAATTLLAGSTFPAFALVPGDRVGNDLGRDERGLDTLS